MSTRQNSGILATIIHHLCMTGVWVKNVRSRDRKFWSIFSSESSGSWVLNSDPYPCMCDQFLGFECVKLMNSEVVHSIWHVVTMISFGEASFDRHIAENHSQSYTHFASEVKSQLFTMGGFRSHGSDLTWMVSNRTYYNHNSITVNQI